MSQSLVSTPCARLITYKTPQVGADNYQLN